MNQNALIVRILGDILIPVLGFFFWNWNLYFIVLFLLLDLLAGEIVVHLKTRKIKSYSEKVNSHSWNRFALISLALFATTTTLVHLGVKVLHPQVDLTNEFISFLRYEDMGFAQGYVLIPLVGFMAYTKYQTEFIRPKVFQFVEVEVVWRHHFKIHLLVLFLTLNCLLFCFFHFTELVYLILILVAMVGFRYVEYRKSIK